MMPEPSFILHLVALDEWANRIHPRDFEYTSEAISFTARP
jgi:hypothetical protein